MKRRFSVALLLPAMLFASACKAPPDQSIIVSSARAPGLACDFSDATKYVEGGLLDVAVPAQLQSYFQVFSWENDLQNISVTVTSQITTATPNTFIATTIVDNYNLVGGKSPPQGLVSISAAITPGALPASNSVGVFLVDQTAIGDICGTPLVFGNATCGGKGQPACAVDNCPNFTGGSSTLLVTFQIAGALVGGGAAQTNPVTFPVTLFKGNLVDTNGACWQDPAFPKVKTIPITTTCNWPRACTTSPCWRD